MPNYVMNLITLQGSDERIREMLDEIKNDKEGYGSVDFDKIIPMPEPLNINAGSKMNDGLKAYRDFIEVYTLGGTRKDLDLLNIPIESEKAFLSMRTDIEPEEWELGKIAFQNILRYGAPSWYEWSIHNWGTKWNADSYGFDESNRGEQNNSLCFQTAWSPPHPILERLSEMNPDISFEHEWADEDIGCNCGRRTYVGGIRMEEYTPESQREAVEFSMGLWDYEPEDLGVALNKAGTAYIRLDNDGYQLIELFDKPAMFTNERLTDEDIPEGLYCYHLREFDDGDRFCTIEPRVVVNHGGSVITNEPIDFGEAGYIEFTDETSPNFVGSDITFEDYMTGNFDLEQTQEEQHL